MRKAWSKAALLMVAAAVLMTAASCGSKPPAGGNETGAANAAGTGSGSSSLTSPGDETSGAGGSENGAGPAGGSGAPAGGGTSAGTGGQQGSGGGSGAASPQTKKTIEVYVTDAAINKLYPLKSEILYSTEESKIKAALEALAAAKADGRMGLWSGVEFKRVSVKDGAVTADITLPDKSRLGAPGEELALQAIQKTVFQFEEIKSLDILVDGKAVDSLMGHLDLEHPIMRSGGHN